MSSATILTPVVFAAAPNTLPATSSEISITQVPFFVSSSAGSPQLTMTPDNKLIFFSEIGIRINDLSATDPHWRRFFDYEGYQGQNTGAGGVGSLVADPANPDVSYFCKGDNNTDNSSTINSYTYLDMAGIFRSVDGLDSAQQITGNSLTWETGTNPSWERLVLGCASKAHNRYLVEPGTGISMWYLMDRNPLFAFDDRETVALDGSGPSMSKTFYFMTSQMGLYQATYDSIGRSLTWENVHMAPVIVDDGVAGGIFNYAGISQDKFYFQYNGYSGLSTYAPESGTHNCTYEFDGGEVYGEYDTVSVECIEDEVHGMGSTVIIDPVYQTYNKSVGENNKAVLYAGYFVQKPIWTHGGLYRGVADSTGTFTWTEILNPDTGESIDARGVDCDATQSVTVNGEKMAKYCYVAGGRSGVFKLTVESDGSVNISSENTNLTTRDDYVTSCGSSCTNSVSYQYLSIDQAYVDGTSYLLLISSTTWRVYYAIEDFSGALDWKELNLIGEVDSTETQNAGGGVIDTRGKRFFITTGPVLSLAVSDLASAEASTSSSPSGMWTVWEDGFGDRVGSNFAFDPISPDRRVHFPGIDPTYSSVEWDKDYQKVLSYSRPKELGFCYGMQYSDATSADRFRYNSYGNQVLSGTSKSTGDSVLYSSASASVNYDGAITRGKWDTTLGDWRWELATGDKSCTVINAGTYSGCYYVCDRTASTGALPKMQMSHLAVDPQDADHLVVIGMVSSDSTYHMYESINGGDNWTDKSSSYVYGSTSGVSLNVLGALEKVIFDPKDANIIYIAYLGYASVDAGIFRLDLSQGFAIDITNPDMASENKSGATTLPPYDSISSTYTSLGTTKYKVSAIYDLVATSDSSSGKTKLFIAVAPYCDSGWGYFPFSSCTDSGYVNGGGIYARLIDPDPTKDALIFWDKLNASSTDYANFMAYAVAVSPADPNVIVAVGANEFGWSSQGNPQDLSAGLIYSKDAGVTWQAATLTPINAYSVAAHPTKKNNFVFGIVNGGVWELNLNNSDADSDGVSDSSDNCATVVNALQTDTDGDGEGNDCDLDDDGDGLADSIDPNSTKANTWYWVNSKTGTVLNSGDASDGKSYTYIAGTYLAGQVIVNGVVDKTKAYAGSTFKDCQGTTSSVSSKNSSVIAGNKSITKNMAPPKGSILNKATQPTDQTAPIVNSSGKKITFANINTGIIKNSQTGTYGVCILNITAPVTTKGGKETPMLLKKTETKVKTKITNR